MANAIKVALAELLKVVADLKAQGIDINVVEHPSDKKLYKGGTSGSSPCVQLHFGAKNQLVGSMWVVNCLVSTGRPHSNVEKAGWYGSVQQEITWGSADEAKRFLRDALLDIAQGKIAALAKGGKGQGAPTHRRDEKTGEVLVAVEPKAEEPEEDEALEQAAAQVQ